MSFVSFEELNGTWLENAKHTVAMRRDAKAIKAGGFLCFGYVSDPHVDTLDDFVKVYLDSLTWGAIPDESFDAFLSDPLNYKVLKEGLVNKVSENDYYSLMKRAKKPIRKFNYEIGKTTYDKYSDPVYSSSDAASATFEVTFKGVNYSKGVYTHECVVERDSCYGTCTDSHFIFQIRDLINAIKEKKELISEESSEYFTYKGNTIMFNLYGEQIFSFYVTDENIGYTIASLKRFDKEIRKKYDAIDDTLHYMAY